MKKTLVCCALAALLASCETRNGAITDIDGNTYTSVVIGDQEWMVENFKATRLNDGTPLDFYGSDEDWKSAVTSGIPCWTVYGEQGDAEMAVESKNYQKYGVLYNFAAVATGKLAPKDGGWRVATHQDWAILEAYLISHGYNCDGTLTDNKVAKSMVARANWKDNPDEGLEDVGSKGTYLHADNTSRFNALPAGDRRVTGEFVFLGEQTFWWTSTPSTEETAWSYSLSNTEPDLISCPYQMTYGFSVRCVRDVKK